MLDNFLTPTTVAVIGAAREEGKVGHDILKNLVKGDFPGKVYPINPKADEILGIPCYPSVLDVSDDIDLAVIVIPAKIILKVLDDLAKKRVPAAIIITAGFKESGLEGAALERKMGELCRRAKIRVMGPNCLGLINTQHNLNASFAPDCPARGNIAFFSQSGALCTAILDWALGAGVGFSKFVSLGNKLDIDEVDLLHAFADDDATDVILGYVEGVKDGVKFMEAAKAASRKKPVIIAKSGGTEAGARAASSHTGSLAGSEKAFVAAFHQSGVIRAMSIQDLFDFALTFSYQKPPAGPNLALITNAGGPGIIAADAVERSRLSMASLEKETVDRLRAALPPTAAFYNPVDVIGDAKADRYEAALNAVAKDPNVDALLVLLTPQAMTEPEKTAESIARTKKATEKPILTSFMGGPRVADATKLLNNAKVPNYEFPEQAISALEAMYCYSKWRSKPEAPHVEVESHPDKAAKILDVARREKHFTLPENEAKHVLTTYWFRVPRSILAQTSDDAARAGKAIGFPVVMKIASPDIVHKSDIGGVKVGVQDEDEARKAFLEMRQNARRRMPEAEIWGVSVQEMITGGKEIILGMSRDPQFGPMLMFGLGGIYVEVLKDVSFRIAPINSDDADEMVREIRSYALLTGVRGERGADLEAVKLDLLRLSKLVTDNPQILELDINPLIALPAGEGTIAVDARIAIEGE